MYHGFYISPGGITSYMKRCFGAENIIFSKRYARDRDRYVIGGLRKGHIGSFFLDYERIAIAKTDVAAGAYNKFLIM